MRLSRAGMGEGMLAAEFEYHCSMKGAQRGAYVPVVASGCVQTLILTSSLSRGDQSELAGHPLHQQRLSHRACRRPFCLLLQHSEKTDEVKVSSS